MEQNDAADERLSDRAEILAVVLSGVDRLAELADVLAAASDQHDAVALVRAQFDLTELEAHALLSTPLERLLAGYQRDRMRTELSEVQARLNAP